MKIEIKKSIKPVEYKEAIDFLEKRLVQINQKKKMSLFGYQNIQTFTQQELATMKMRFQINQ